MKFSEIFNLKYPFIQGGMANIATGEFAAKVSNAGAMGLIAGGALTAEQLEKEILEAKKITDKPFGVNLMLMNRESEKMAEIIIKHKVPFVTTGAGNPSAFIPKFKEANIIVYPVVPSVALAKRVERHGADGIIAEGTEAGGHVGEMTTMALIPQVVSNVSVPVIAAGGMATGAQILAASLLGASGVQMGTIMLSAYECPIHEKYKEAVISAKADDTVVAGRTKGVPVRSIKNKMTRKYIKLETSGADKDELEHFTLGALRKAVLDGDTEMGSLMAGQVAGLVDKVRPLKELFEKLEQEFEEAKVNASKIKLS